MATAGLYADDGSMRVTSTDGAGTGTSSPGQESTTAGQVGPLVQGAVTSGVPTYTTGKTDPISLTTSGLLRVGLFNNSNISVAGTAGTGANAIRVSPATDANFGVNPYPWSTTAGTQATPITASSGNVANASAVATLAATSGKTTYITGFQVTASGATAGSDQTVTVVGVITGTMSYTFTFPTGAVVGGTPLVVTFPFPVPASTTNTTIVVTLPAGGAGNTNATVSAQGFQL